jgi:uncharacterized protein YgbK (DUF1537 family)
VSRAQSEALAAEPGVVTVEPAADAVSAALASGADVLVHPVTSASAASLARGTAGARALVLVGGETARAVLTAMGVTRFRLVDEIERGVPRAVLEGPPPRPVVTKAGAFGDRDTLLRCRRALRR